MRHEEKAISRFFEIGRDIHLFKEEKFIQAVRLYGKDFKKISGYFDNIIPPRYLAMYKHHV